MKLTCFHTAKWALILLPLLLTFGTKSAIAQITPATDGTGTVVQTQNNQINISGGTQAGQNQFHSFQQFGVNAGQTANFMANPNIANILGRVTGGDASLINGILKVSGSNANLYLMNPAGIVFGKDASLNVPGAFTATTANGIGFGNGNWFNAVGSNNYAVLTANPTSFGFSGLSGSIVNAGNLSVNPGQSIALVGGTVVNTGTIAAPGGNITIAAIPGGKMVRIAQAGTVLSFDLPMSDRVLINAPIATPLSLPALLTGGSISSAMGVVVEDGVIKLTGGSASVTGTINADGTGVQNGGNAIVYADNHLNFGGTISAKGGELGGNGGFVDTSGKGSIAIAPNARVLTTAVKGLTGTWLIDPADLEVVAGTGGTGAIVGGTNSPTTASTIGAGTIVTALNSTDVNLQATNSITVNAAIDARLNNSAGNLTLTAPTANLNQAIALKAGSTLSGTAATVNVGATGTVQNGIDVSASNGTVNLAAATYTLTNTGGINEYAIVINKNVIVRGAGAGNTTVSGNDTGSVFDIGSGKTVALDRLSIVNGNGLFGGGISNDGTLTMSNSTLSGNSAQFYGGGIFNSGTLTMSNSTLSGNSARFGGGGIFNSGTLTMSNSIVSGNVAQSGGGISNYGTLTMSNSTLSGNSAQFGGGIPRNSAQVVGGGIFNSGTLTIGNSIVSGNTASLGREIRNVSIFTSQGYNLFGYSEDSGLSGATASATDIIPTVALGQIIGPLANNGGPTQTHALVLNSPALDAGDPTSTVTTDQRGGQRGSAGLNAGSRIDIGAYEATSSVLVTNTLDTNATGTLRNAIGFANSNVNPTATISPTDIRFNIGTVGSAQTIALTSALPAIVKDTTIDGWTQGVTGYSGVPLITVSGSNLFRVFEVGSGTTVGMNGLSIVNGRTSTNGGGILNSGTLTMSNSTLSGNSAQSGGGIINNGTLTMSNSTLSGNSAQSGGGILNNGGRRLTIGNSTLSGNSAQSGGGIFNLGMLTIGNSTLSGNVAQSGGGISNYGTLTIGNSIVSGNTAPSGREIQNGAPFTSQGYNLFGYSGDSGLLGAATVPTDIIPSAALSTLLAPLGNYGGPTKTHALLPGSAAINAGNAASTTLDQRGKARVGTADIGAFESQGFTFATTAGTPQNVTVGQAAATPLTVKVTANNAIEPVAEGIVTFTAPNTIDASLATVINKATIDEFGNASPAATANTKVGTYNVLATANGVTPTQTFALTNLADVANAIVLTSGSGQSAVVDNDFKDKLVATVTDQYGNPVANSTVTFSASGTTANGIFATNTAITDVNGVATIVIKANTKAGGFTAKGGVIGVTGTADFALTNLADIAKNIVTTSGSGQSTVVDTNFANSLVATVTDKFGNPVSNSIVTFSVPETDASGVFVTNTATTNASGVATIAIKANTKAGLFTAQGGVTGVTGTADFALTNLADVAKNIVTTSGAGQSTVVDTNFANSLVATVTDKFGNPVSNSTVTFSVPGTDASGVFVTNTANTDVNGKATIAIKANPKAGAFTTSGSVNGVTSTADFNLTNLADVASQITTTAGSGQSTVVNTDFAKNLVATVTDKFGNPIENTTVTFNVPGTNASGTFATNTANTANTDVNGKATIAIKANTKAGTFTAIGKVTGITQGADFALTNDPAPIAINPTQPTQPTQPTNSTNPANPTDTPIVNKDSKIEDRTRNLDNRNPEKPIVLPSSGKAILCVERSTGSSSGNDPYKGIPSCDSSVTQSKPIVGNTSRNGNLLAPPQAQTDDKRSVVDPR